ncbi:hypothetical protein PG997_007059 [Apiospora hydei]|uniref:Uncharacterized protein n=1 Tax=Apiospora hydei TaxID=1337664 RepID=A0ABR1WSB0_9PEZI
MTNAVYPIRFKSTVRCNQPPGIVGSLVKVEFLNGQVSDAEDHFVIRLQNLFNAFQQRVHIAGRSLS